MKKRIFTLLVLALLVVSATLPLYGCEETEESSVGSQTEVSDGSFFGLDIPEGTNYDGKTVRVLTTSVTETATSYQIQPDNNSLYNAETATAAITAAAECTRLVEERLNVEIEEECIVTLSRIGGEMYKRIYNDALSLTADYLFAMPCVIEAAMLAKDGLLYDLGEISTIDLNNEWWCKPFNETCTIAGHTYFGSSDIGYVSKDATLFVAFNKKMAETNRITEKYGYSSLYEMVDNKAWTQDVMYEMAKSVYQDLNNNNICDPGDVNGMAGQVGVIYWNLIAGGEHIVTKDENDLPVLTLNNERAVSIINNAQDYFSDPQSGFICADDYFSQSKIPVTDIIVPEFKADRCLFFYNALLNLDLIRDMESDFGVLPCPLYDDTQDNYVSNIGAWSATCICIPTSTVGDDVKLAGLVIEALSAACKEKLNPVYYEQTLQYQISRDDDSMRMLDIIFENRTPELAEAYRWGTMTDVLNNMVKAQKGTFVSSYQAAEQATQKAIDETITAFMERDETID
ncbi:MAG: hypothetical protein IJB49_02630 [Clostridia bacterium]|nr:hypothetical protein [Clostridia bacterium]